MTTTTTSKPFFRSRTFWINVAGIALIGLQFALNQDFVVDADFQAVILAVINILIRFRTNQPVTLR